MGQDERKTKETVVEQVVKSIKLGIKEGNYVPGQRLIESSLTESLKVSRGPLREAMWRLSGEGLLDIKPNYGVEVKRLTKEEALGIFDIREVNEGLAARLAAINADPASIKRLKKALELTESSHKDPDLLNFMKANDLFHDTIIEMAENQQLKELIEQLRLPIYRLQFKNIIRGVTSQSVKQHREIFDAISQKDPKKAERAMQRHIRASASLLKKAVD